MYGDDVSAFTDGSQLDTETILQVINGIHHIHSTFELESENKLNFVDLLLLKKHNKMEFSIYREPTQTDHSLSVLSNQRFQQKNDIDLLLHS